MGVFLVKILSQYSDKIGSWLIFSNLQLSIVRWDMVGMLKSLMNPVGTRVIETKLSAVSSQRRLNRFGDVLCCGKEYRDLKSSFAETGPAKLVGIFSFWGFTPQLDDPREVQFSAKVPGYAHGY